jgi:hypothetical protein
MRRTSPVASVRFTPATTQGECSNTGTTEIRLGLDHLVLQIYLPFVLLYISQNGHGNTTTIILQFYNFLQ